MIYFRPIEEHDLLEMAEIRNRLEIRSWCRQHNLIDEQKQMTWYENQSMDPTIEMFAIMCKDSLKRVGVCGLTDISHIHRRAEFSLYINPDEQGRGFGKEALTNLLNVGFDDFNLNIIWGETFEGNPAFHMFTKTFRMKHEGTRRQFYFKEAKYLDADLVSITAEEWRQFR